MTEIGSYLYLSYSENWILNMVGDYESDGGLFYKVSAVDEVYEDIDELTTFFFQYGDGAKSAKSFRDEAYAVLASLSYWPYMHKQHNDEVDEQIRRVDLPTHNAAFIYKVYENELEVIALLAFHSKGEITNIERIIDGRINAHQNRDSHAD